MLKVENVCLDFSGLKAVNKISMEVERGSVTALIGPNGAGKTTLFNIIAGVYQPDAGHIILDGEDITGLKPYEICKHGIARTYQVIKLFSKMSVIDNVKVGMHTRTDVNFFADVFHLKKMRQTEKAVTDRANELLALVGLNDLRYNVSDSLSYGQQRLLEIARALGSDPKLVLLDEPAAGMNSQEKAGLNACIRKIIDMGTTVLIVEHDMEMVMNIADKIYVLSSGKLLAEGTPTEVAENQAVIEAYLGRGDL